MPGYDTAQFYYAFVVKGENFAHSRIFKDHNPNQGLSRGLEFFFANSKTFQDFQGSWKPCVTPLFLPQIIILDLYRNLIYALWHVQDKNLQIYKNTNRFSLFQKMYYYNIIKQ